MSLIKFITPIFSLAAIIGIISCGGEKKSDDDKSSNETSGGGSGAGSTGSLNISINQESVKALPTLSGQQLVDAGQSDQGNKQSLTISTALTGKFGLATVGQPVSNSQVGQFFALECHWADPSTISDNFCPANIAAKLNGLTENELYDTGFKLTSYTLIGILEHATMYLKNTFPSDTQSLKLTATPISSHTYESTTGKGGVSDSTGTPENYVLDIPNFYDRYSEDTTGSSPSYQIFNSDVTGGRYANVHLNKSQNSTQFSSITSYLTQTYLSTEQDGSVARILANNAVSINDYANQDGSDSSQDFNLRTVILINYKTKKFIAKMADGHTRGLVAIGKGGRDIATGDLLAGFYAVKTFGDVDEGPFCVDNSNQYVAENSNCTTELTLWDGSFDAGTYLELNDTEKADLANYLTFFANGDFIPTTHTPNGDAAVSTKHMPDKIVVVEAN